MNIAGEVPMKRKNVARTVSLRPAATLGPHPTVAPSPTAVAVSLPRLTVCHQAIIPFIPWATDRGHRRTISMEQHDSIAPRTPNALLDWR